MPFTSLSTYLDLKTAVKMGIAATVSLYVGLQLSDWIVRPDAIIGGLWCVVTTIVALQTNIGGTYQAVWNRFLGVCVGSITGALFAFLFGAEEFFLGVAIACTVMICSVFNLKDSYRIACLSVAVIIVPWGLHPEISPWVFAFFRFLDTCAGLGLAIFIALSVWPSQALDKLELNMVTHLSVLKHLYRSILESDSHDSAHARSIQSLILEIDQLFKQNQAMLEESKLELWGENERWHAWANLVASLENMLDSILALRPVFGKEVEELIDLGLKQQLGDFMECIDDLFNQLITKLSHLPTPIHLQALQLSMLQLDEQLIRFRNTHTTREYSFNVVESYFVFIYNLKSLAKELMHFSQILEAVFLKP